MKVHRVGDAKLALRPTVRADGMLRTRGDPQRETGRFVVTTPAVFQRDVCD